MNLERLRKKLDNLKNPGNRQFSNNTWRPKKGGEASIIRLIEHPHGEKGDPFMELWFHYNVGQGPGFLCPKMNSGRTCPVCEFNQSLREDGENGSAEPSKELNPVLRFYGIVVDREDPASTPKYWGFGKQVYEFLLEKLFDSEYRHYMEPYEGIDATVKSEKSKGQTYPRTTVTFCRKDSPLAESDREIKKILNSIKPVEEVFEPLTIADIKERLNSWTTFGEDTDFPPKEDAEEVVKTSSEREPDTVRDVEAELEAALKEVRD